MDGMMAAPPWPPSGREGLDREAAERCRERREARDAPHVGIPPLCFLPQRGRDAFLGLQCRP
jgi:hypothetical protein